MSIAVDNMPDRAVFKAKPAELAALVQRHFRLECNAMSPFATPAEWTGGHSEESLRTATDPRFQTAAAILAQPRLRITYRKGGGQSTLEETFSVYSCASGQDEGIVSIHDGGDQSLMVVYFPGPEAYLDWWLEQFASDVFWPPDNPISDVLSLDGLAVILHAVDCYRRAHLESMLSYSPAVGSAITADHFAATIASAAASRDKRWLLPAFLDLTLEGITSVSPGLEHYTAAFAAGFLHAETDNEHGRYYRFGDAAKIMGEEFRTTWLAALGWEATCLRPGGLKELSRAFLAPTAFANHLIFCLDDRQGGRDFSHHALTTGDLKITLRQWMESMAMLAVAPAAASQEALPSASKKCSACGGDNQPKAKFCRKCGKPLV